MEVKNADIHKKVKRINAIYSEWKTMKALLSGINHFAKKDQYKGLDLSTSAIEYRANVSKRIFELKKQLLNIKCE